MTDDPFRARPLPQPEVRAVLQRAMALAAEDMSMRDEGTALSEADLARIAEELGLSKEAIARARAAPSEEARDENTRRLAFSVPHPLDEAMRTELLAIARATFHEAGAVESTEDAFTWRAQPLAGGIARRLEARREGETTTFTIEQSMPSMARKVRWMMGATFFLACFVPILVTFSVPPAPSALSVLGSALVLALVTGGGFVLGHGVSRFTEGRMNVALDAVAARCRASIGNFAANDVAARKRIAAPPKRVAIEEEAAAEEGDPAEEGEARTRRA